MGYSDTYLSPSHLFQPFTLLLPFRIPFEYVPGPCWSGIFFLSKTNKCILYLARETIYQLQKNTESAYCLDSRLICLLSNRLIRKQLRIAGLNIKNGTSPKYGGKPFFRYAPVNRVFRKRTCKIRSSASLLF